MADALNALPAALLALVEEHMRAAGLDYASPAAMHSKCERQSVELAHSISAARVVEVDEDGDEWAIPHDAWTTRLWADGRVPAAIKGDDLAIGHVVCVVDWDGEEYRIDLTAAQFPELGWTGPRAEFLG